MTLRIEAAIAKCNRGGMPVTELPTPRKGNAGHGMQLRYNLCHAASKQFE